MKSIKTIRSLVLLLMLAAGAAACSKHDDITPAVWNGEIRLSSEISSQVKTPTSDVPNDQQIAAGQIVSFFVDNAGTNGSSATPLYENYLVTANGSGGFTKCNAQEADMCYPATGNVDIYAFQINTVGSSTAFPTNTTPLTHSVSPDQSQNYGENYLKSDLLYAANKGVQRSNNAVPMKFYHLLSKVEVALKTGEPCLTNAVVTIENTRLKANFQPDKSANINDATSGQAARANMITLPTDADSNPAASITLATALSADLTTYASAVVVPQEMTKGSHFIKVQPNGVAPLYYTLPENLNLESGKKYQFKITVNLTELTVETSTITSWESEKPSDVTAIIPIGSKDIAFARIGDFYFSDGTIESGDNTLTEDQKTACIGIVFKMGRDVQGDWKDDCAYCTKAGSSMSIINGYVLALYDAKDNNGNSLHKWYLYTGSNCREIGTVETNHGFYGYKNTQIIKQYAKTNDKTFKDFFPATYYATDGYDAQYPAPAGSSGWFLPSANQLLYFSQNKDWFLRQIKKATGNDNYIWPEKYWSSTESDGNWPALYLLVNRPILSGESKEAALNVRSILAF